MFSRSRKLVVLAVCSLVAAASATGAATTAVQPAPHPRVLRVAADPNNLPFSNSRGEGFENRLVELIARELGATIEYTWWAQHRGWVRQTLKDRECDLVPGVPWHIDRMLTTRPYYRSTYTLVFRRDHPLADASLDAAELRTRRIGVQMVGDDFANTPPAHALSARGIVDNVRGFPVYGDYSQPNPPIRILQAVLDREIDVAAVWGPFAGYFARQHPDTVTVAPLPASDPRSRQVFVFPISVGVRKSEPALRDEIDAILVRRKADIDALLESFGVPVVSSPAPSS
jgi:quinoprotein dehydrogenase-associated probable ABC transporter substrate-binding protein